MLAWTQQVPKDGGPSNGRRFDVGTPDVPPELDHLPAFLDELGVCNEGMNGAMPLTFADVDRWAARVRFEPSPFESRALVFMSRAYVNVARTPDAVCPIEDADTRRSVDAVNLASWRAFAAAAAAESEADG